MEPGATMSVELVLVLIGSDTGILFDNGVVVVVVCVTELNTSTGMDSGFIFGTLIEIGIVICCGDFVEGIERSGATIDCDKKPEVGTAIEPGAPVVSVE